MIKICFDKKEVLNSLQDYILSEKVYKELGEPLLLRPNDFFGVYTVEGYTKAFFCINIKLDKCFLRYVYVDPDCRGKGIFSQLMNEVEQICKNQNAKEINAVSTNMALNLYVKRGYQIKKQFTNYHKISKQL